MTNNKPSRVRWKILGLLFLISVVTYIDRVNIAIAGREMIPELGLSAVQMGAAFSAFVLGYALFQIPGGWLGDRWGPRSVLTFAGLMLSLGAGILYVTVGAYWASTIDFSHKHSGALSGLMNMGANLGGTISPTLTPFIGERWGWLVALTVAAGVAFLGSLLWLGVRFGQELGAQQIDGTKRSPDL